MRLRSASPLLKSLALALAGAALSAGTPQAAPGAFKDNPIIYFLMTDRFVNGDPSNDNSYGRKREATPKADVATFHGGDLKGITKKLKEGWFRDLGVNAIWITAPYEQIHGWVQGANAGFKHYAYHGYYALDYTVLDRNMGTEADLKEMIDTAHAQGIRILFDIVMNHPGYLDHQTAKEYKIDVIYDGWEKTSIRSYHSYIDYNSFKFADWWGRAWVRAGLPGYIDGGRDDLTMQIAYLPDFRTESKEFVKLPAFLKNKPDTKAVDLPETTVRGYLVKWLTDWVRRFGVDGFRCDTVKHVEPEAWAALKQEATKALAEWKAAHPKERIDDAPFWMVGEYWGSGAMKMLPHGFDAMINFDFQGEEGNFSKPRKLFAEYAKLESGHAPTRLNYISSHDTRLFERDRLIDGGTALLLCPGAVQIFYGDETARPEGFTPPGDLQQATRSDMNWDSMDQKVLAHWRKLGSFRQRHVAVARGEHKELGASPYVFSRAEGADKVVVALGAKGETSIPVAGAFNDGDKVQDAYTGKEYVVAGGAVKVQAEACVLLEKIQ